MPATAGRIEDSAPEGPPRFDPAGPSSAPVARDADALAAPVAAAVLACPAVSQLSAGPFGTVGTYLPGRRIAGVQITETTVTVRVVAYPVALWIVEKQVRAAVAALVPELPIDIGIDDLDTGPPHT